MISKLIGANAVPAITAVGNVVDQIFTSDEEKLDKQIVLERLAQQPQIAQIELNKVEAAHRTIFVAGWRPFIGWICGVALAYNYILRDLISWYLRARASLSAELTPEQITAISTPPTLDIGTLNTVLFALLGLGGYRMIEKLQGRAR